jgi:predicted MFS family arabinose efflux permease
MLGAYGPLFATSRARRLVVAGLTGRAAFGMFDLTIVIFAREVSGSYALAGLAVAAHAIGIGLSAPLRGRAVDRRGPRRAVLWCGALHAACLLALPLAGETGSTAAIVALSAVAGLSVPPLVPAMRVQWQRLLGHRDPRLAQAYAFEAVAQITLFIIGPLVAGGGIALIGAGATLAASAGLVILGGGTFAVLAGAEPNSAPARGGLLGPIGLPGIRSLVVVCTLADAALGVVDVTVPAFAREHGEAGVAGLLLAVFSASSVIGGTVYGARRFAGPPARRLGVLMGVAAVAWAPLALADSPAWLAAALLLAGAPAAAQWATASLALDAIGPDGGGAEAYTWLSTANAMGVAAGAAVAGIAVEAAGTSAAFLAGAGALAVAAALTVALRAPLSPA